MIRSFVAGMLPSEAEYSWQKFATKSSQKKAVSMLLTNEMLLLLLASWWKREYNKIKYTFSFWGINFTYDGFFAFWNSDNGSKTHLAVEFNLSFSDSKWIYNWKTWTLNNLVYCSCSSWFVILSSVFLKQTFYVSHLRSLEVAQTKGGVNWVGERKQMIRSTRSRTQFTNFIKKMQKKKTITNILTIFKETVVLGGLDIAYEQVLGLGGG